MVNQIKKLVAFLSYKSELIVGLTLSFVYNVSRKVKRV